MNKTLLFALALLFAGSAVAQQYKWVDKDGKVRYGDVPPPGVKATPLRPPPGPAAPPPSASGKDAKGAPNRPLTPAEQEAEFRKRQQDAAKSREKEEKTAQEKQQRRESCESAQEALRALESGQRIARTDAKGERFFLDDEQRAAELTKARRVASESCN